MGLATDHDGRREFLASAVRGESAEKLLNLPEELMTHVYVCRFAATSQLMGEILRT